MNFDTTLSKKYFQYDTSKSTEFEAILNNCLGPAKNQFRSKIGIDEFKRFVNYTNFTATSKDADNITFNYDSSVSVIEVNDIVVIDNIMFTVVETDDNIFVIDKEYSGSVLIVENETMNIYTSLYAWYILLVFLTVDRELYIGIVLENNQEFGDGSQFPAYDPVKSYRKEIIENINSEYSSILVNQPNIELGRM